MFVIRGFSAPLVTDSSQRRCNSGKVAQQLFSEPAIIPTVEMLPDKQDDSDEHAGDAYDKLLECGHMQGEEHSAHNQCRHPHRRTNEEHFSQVDTHGLWRRPAGRRIENRSQLHTITITCGVTL